ncbi:zeta toxin family protein [Legionella tucsonensis]|uniref:Coiled-coil protein n=1 Tax=Legionella tucsonensis TaxID=40335 RepID=A0A0W0ZWJ5_9GAMM|nr:zeta toxin family protein [Legionella tucsonensis]KTD73434.1 coiled-coil protein [Legionella tucsonensis]
MSYEDRFFVPTVELKERIKSKQEVRPEDFTIIAYSSSGGDESSITLLEQTTAAFPKELVRNLVCLYPGRLVEHEILAQLQATIKLDKHVDDELDTFGYAFTMVQKKLVGEAINRMESKIGLMHANTKIDVIEFFNDLAHGKSKEVYPFSTEELEALRSFHASVSGKEPWSTDKELLKDVCVQRAMALIYTQRARAIIEPVVAGSINELCEQRTLERLEYVEKERSVAVFTTGGVASGKGSCLKLVSKVIGQYEPEPIAWNQLVHHNADRLKPFLQKPEVDPLKYSQFTYEEALLVKERVMQVIAKKSNILEGERYPGFLHDQTKLKPDELREANQRYGEVDIVAISTDVAAAVERAHGRGKSTQRYEHTEGLLGSHQAVPGEMIKSLNQEELIGSNVSVAMFDNNSPTRELTMFAAVNMRTKEIIIYNEEMMQNWIKKENINPKAKPGESLYLEKPVRSITEYFGPLIERGFEFELEAPEATMKFKV